VTYPLGYPLASSGLTQASPSGGELAPISATKDSVASSSSPRRLSPRKVAALKGRLSVRDEEVMRLVGRFRIISGAQLQRLFWPEGPPPTRERLARHGLTRLARLGVLAPLGRTVGGVRAGSRGRCFALGLAGQRLLADASHRRPRQPHTPGERHLAHTVAVAELYVNLIEAQRWGLVEILDFDPEPACWRHYSGPWGARRTLKPDAYLRLGAGEYIYSWLVECDMATESLTTIAAKARRHLEYYQSGAEQRSHRVAARVAWIVPGYRRADDLRELFAKLPTDAKGLFSATTTADVMAVLTGDTKS
jgi:Replication-relaxation